MEAFVQIFNRDLEKLALEIESFKKDENLWKTQGAISNSAGNLCLHLIGNLNHFIGEVIGKSGYVRDREAEFNDKDVDKGQLLKMILETKGVVASTINKFDKEKLRSYYPINLFGDPMTYEFLIIHLTTHLSYHLGQINYLRRILDKG